MSAGKNQLHEKCSSLLNADPVCWRFACYNPEDKRAVQGYPFCSVSRTLKPVS